MSIVVRFKLRADWKEDCETLTDWDVRYYIDWDFTEWNPVSADLNTSVRYETNQSLTLLVFVGKTIKIRINTA